jgi:hypothetical protein
MVGERELAYFDGERTVAGMVKLIEEGIERQRRSTALRAYAALMATN